MHAPRCGFWENSNDKSRPETVADGLSANGLSHAGSAKSVGATQTSAKRRKDVIVPRPRGKPCGACTKNDDEDHGVAKALGIACPLTLYSGGGG